MSIKHSVTELGYAKINLTLDILERLPDGYHKMKSVMQQIDLHDEVTVTAREDENIIIHCDNPRVPLNEKNIVWKVTDLIRKASHIKEGVDIAIVKRIPVEGGLAGGSADAAATIKALNKLWNLSLSMDECLAFGEKVGMDVPFCIAGGTAWVHDKGQKVVPMTPFPKHYVVIANTGLAISTAEAFRSLDSTLDWEKQSDARSLGLIAALEHGAADKLYSYLSNDFEQFAFERHPELREIVNIMLANGADAAHLSGSGASLFALAKEKTQAEKIVKALEGALPFLALTWTV